MFEWQQGISRSCQYMHTNIIQPGIGWYLCHSFERTGRIGIHRFPEKLRSMACKDNDRTFIYSCWWPSETNLIIFRLQSERTLEVGIIKNTYIADREPEMWKCFCFPRRVSLYRLSWPLAGNFAANRWKRINRRRNCIHWEIPAIKPWANWKSSQYGKKTHPGKK